MNENCQDCFYRQLMRVVHLSDGRMSGILVFALGVGLSGYLIIHMM